ncbi:MAG: hypothetical protein QXR12_03580 [Thermofilum sp.]
MFTVKCEKCGFVFYKGAKPPTLYRIYVQYGGRCPRCGLEIGWVPKEIEVEHKRKVQMMK